MSGRWIVLGDTRVNVEAQADQSSGQVVVDALRRLYAVHTIVEDQEDDYDH